MDAVVAQVQSWFFEFLSLIGVQATQIGYQWALIQIAIIQSDQLANA